MPDPKLFYPGWTKSNQKCSALGFGKTSRSTLNNMILELLLPKTLWSFRNVSSLFSFRMLEAQRLEINSRLQATLGHKPCVNSTPSLRLYN